MFIDTSASMCCECVCAFASDYASVYSLIQVRPCVVSVCAIVSDYASVCSLIQVCPCVVSVCDIVSDYATLLCVLIETSASMCCECVCLC